MKSNEGKHGRGSPLSPSKEEKMKKCVRGKPEFRSPLLNILVALTVLIAFGAMFSTGCKNDVDTSENSFEMVFMLDEVLYDQTDEECFEEDFNLDYAKRESNSNSNEEIELSKLEPSARDCPDKVGTDIVASARDWPDKVICLEAEDSESSMLAGINFGNIPGNFGDVPFALLGVLTPAIAIRRRRQGTVLFSRFKPKDLQFLGLALIAAMFGVIMLASGFAITVSLTPLLTVGAATLLMTAKKPEFAFATCASQGDESSESEINLKIEARRALLSEKHYANCLKSFKLVANEDGETIANLKKELDNLCFLTPEAVNRAYAEVFE